jgi:anti-sigma B factor antagonist
MALGLESRRVGDVTVVTCTGRLVGGEEAAAFQRVVDSLMPVNPHIVLHLAGIEFIDSAGLGLLVRYYMRTRNAHGTLAICALPAKVVEVLKITRLNAVFQTYETEADAIADAHRPGKGQDTAFVNPDVLCVDRSPDVLTYLRELLKGAGYGALTAANLPDALILLIATRPSVVVVGPELRATGGIGAVEEFQRLAKSRAVLELPADFAGLDAGEAAEHVLNAVRAHVPARADRALKNAGLV